MALLATVYCTEAEIKRYISSQAIDDHADLNNDGIPDDEVINDVINQATEEIDAYATQQYDQAGLASSTLINRWAVVLSVVFLFQRNGNPVPDSLQSEFDRIFARLEMIPDQKYQLPGVALRGDHRPTMSNLTVDRRYHQSKLRVQQANSSDPPTQLTQDKTTDSPVVFD